MNNKTTIRFITLGCPKNLVDSDVMAGALPQGEFTIVAPEKPSDVVVVNTCGFIEEAKEESIQTILQLAEEKKNNQLKLLIVAGCLSQRYARQLPRALPEVDAFVGTSDFARLAWLITKKLQGNRQRNFVGRPAESLLWQPTPTHSTPFYSRYVKISEGCSHECSFCTIPMIRGSLRSRPSSDILREIELGRDEGVKEFNIIAQDLNEYGQDLNTKESLYHLFSTLADCDGEFWIRPLYMYPLRFSDRLIRAMSCHPKIIPYVDIPFQHIDDGILRSMHRGSSPRYIYRLIEKLRKEIPGIVLRTSLITGYPGEGEKEFKKLHNFIREVQFDRLGVFTFSREEGTAAYSFPNQVDRPIREERRHVLMETQRGISKRKNQSYVGQTQRVLFEGDHPAEYDLSLNDHYPILGVGRYYGQAPEIDGQVIVRAKRGKAPLVRVGEFVDVKIVEGLDYDLVGEVEWG